MIPFLFPRKANRILPYEEINMLTDFTKDFNRNSYRPTFRFLDRFLPPSPSLKPFSILGDFAVGALNEWSDLLVAFYKLKITIQFRVEKYSELTYNSCNT